MPQGKKFRNLAGKKVGKREKQKLIYKIKYR
jgi:hypothetical protein